MFSDHRAMPMEYTQVLSAAIHKPVCERNHATTIIDSKIELCIGLAIHR